MYEIVPWKQEKYNILRELIYVTWEFIKIDFCCHVMRDIR